MSALLVKSFEEYIVKQKNDDQDDEEEKNEDKKVDLGIYDKLKKENKKEPASIFFFLLTKIFDMEIALVKEYFNGYLM